jgi:hypothetical protein
VEVVGPEVGPPSPWEMLRSSGLYPSGPSAWLPSQEIVVMLVAAVQTRAKWFAGLRLMLKSVVCKGEEHDDPIQSCSPVRDDDISSKTERLTLDRAPLGILCCLATVGARKRSSLAGGKTSGRRAACRSIFPSFAASIKPDVALQPLEVDDLGEITTETLSRLMTMHTPEDGNHGRRSLFIADAHRDAFV